MGYQIILLGEQTHMGVNNFAQSCRLTVCGQALNPRPLDHKSNALPLHRQVTRSMVFCTTARSMKYSIFNNVSHQNKQIKLIGNKIADLFQCLSLESTYGFPTTINSALARVTATLNLWQNIKISVNQMFAVDYILQTNDYNHHLYWSWRSKN